MINYISNQKCGIEKISSKIAEYILRFFYDKYEYLKPDIEDGEWRDHV